MHRVFFDTNEGNPDVGYWLNLPMSRLNLESIGPGIQEGLHVIIFMPGELEMEAVLKFDQEGDHWIAIPVPGTVIHY